MQSSSELKTEKMTAVQLKKFKAVQLLLCHLLVTNDEAEYFEFSAELLKQATDLIRSSQFATKNPEMSYGEQAVEFSVDSLNESVEEMRIRNTDH